jgi:hypothetical protein
MGTSASLGFALKSRCESMKLALLHVDKFTSSSSLKEGYGE